MTTPPEPTSSTSSPAGPRPYPLPSALAARTRFALLGRQRIPALLSHPDWVSPAPACLWMHGRTVSKELDNGRYLRWIRAGIAAVALDLPGHGERYDPSFQTGARTPELIGQMVGELDGVIEALAEPPFAELFDLDRLAIGGMSAGGMCALRKLCNPGHGFAAACVESTTGDVASLFGGRFDPATVSAVNPAAHVASFMPIPLLALHSETDRVVPLASQAGFLNLLREHYRAAGADPGLIELYTWPTTGAPEEHNGFGRFAAEAKTKQVDFLSKWLAPVPPGVSF